jgi:hypothetical protein
VWTVPWRNASAIEIILVQAAAPIKHGGTPSGAELLSSY